MEKAIIQTLKYFLLFDYPPTAGEIYTFLPKKLNKQRFLGILQKMTKQRLIKTHKLSDYGLNNRKLPACQENRKTEDCFRYTLGEYSINNVKRLTLNVERFYERYVTSQNKLNSLRFKLYIKLISIFPQIKLVGLSGTVAMMNAQDNDDIDLFIITAKNRLFTGRFITIILASLLHIRRIRPISPINPKSHKNKVCLNLFFDESGLAVPKFKKTPYVAHEILQMKPLIVKDNVYEQFLKANRWVFKTFPNASEDFHGFIADSHGYPCKSVIQNPRKSKISGLIESCLKNLQLRLIKKHQTLEIVTNHQLWFHPEDFGKKLGNSCSS